MDWFTVFLVFFGFFGIAFICLGFFLAGTDCFRQNKKQEPCKFYTNIKAIQRTKKETEDKEI